MILEMSSGRRREERVINRPVSAVRDPNELDHIQKRSNVGTGPFRANLSNTICALATFSNPTATGNG